VKARAAYVPLNKEADRVFSCQ